jgi:N-methylhydantoinase B
MSAPAAPVFDGLQLALLTNRFDGIVRAMMNTLLRTARSAILATARDFSCCILTAGDEMLAMAESLPIHVMSGPDLMARTMKSFHPDFKPGDAFLHNSPYHGNSHAADWSVLVPVFDDDGVHRYTVLAKAHLADCGNSVPTTYVAGARDVYEEGALVFPCVRVQENYAHVEDVIRTCRLRIRVPDLWYGDLLAILGAARIGERRLRELVREVGPETLELYQREWFDYSERRMIAAIRRLPGGTATYETRHDPVPGAPEGVPVKVTVTVDTADATIEVDLRDNLDCQPCGLNLTEATARTAAMMGVFTGIGATGDVMPPNAGSFRRLRIQLRENCVVGIPRHPFSCSAATTDLSEATAKCVAGAMATLGEIGMAEIGRAQPVSMSVISGHDPRTGSPFVNQLMLAVTGGAGAPHADGWLTILGIGAAGFLFRDSVEIDEMKYPIRVWEQRIIPDSEGAGRYRGSPGALVEFGPVDCSMEVMYLSDGTYNPARGVRGGGSGAPAQQRKRFGDGRLSDELGCYARVTLGPDETILSYSSAGGGYGPPHEREPMRVRKDVLEGYVTPERARDVYRVSVGDDGGVAETETARLRR